jgi:curved DNA-binding protein CbpA
MAKSYFAILEVTSDATPDEVHSAYRRLAKAFHRITMGVTANLFSKSMKPIQY